MKPNQRRCRQLSWFKGGGKSTPFPHLSLTQVPIQPGAPREKRQWRKGKSFLMGKLIRSNGFWGQRLMPDFFRGPMRFIITPICIHSCISENMWWWRQISHPPCQKKYGLISYWFHFSSLAISLLSLVCFLSYGYGYENGEAWWRYRAKERWYLKKSYLKHLFAVTDIF